MKKKTYEKIYNVAKFYHDWMKEKDERARKYQSYLLKRIRKLEGEKNGKE